MNRKKSRLTHDRKDKPKPKNSCKQHKKNSASITDTPEINSNIAKSNMKNDKKSITKKNVLSADLPKNDTEEKENKSKFNSGLNRNLSKKVRNNKKKSLELQNQASHVKPFSNLKEGKVKSIFEEKASELNSQLPNRYFNENKKASAKKVDNRSKAIKSSSSFQNGSTNVSNKSDSKTNVKKTDKKSQSSLSNKNILKATDTNDLISISNKISKNNKFTKKKDFVSINTELSKLNPTKNKSELLKKNKQKSKKDINNDSSQLKKQESITNTTDNLNSMESSKNNLKNNKSTSKKIYSIKQKNICKKIQKQTTKPKQVKNKDIQLKQQSIADKAKDLSNIQSSKKGSAQVNTKLSNINSVKNKKILGKLKNNNDLNKPIIKEHDNQSKKRKLTSNISEDLSSAGPSKKFKANIKNTKKVEPNNEIQSIKSKKRKPLTELSLTKNQIIKYVKAIFQIAESEEHKKKSLFSSDKPPILLVLSCIKVPKQPLHQLRIILQHSMVSSNDAVALFVKDLKRGRRIDYEDTVHHYEELLRNNGISQIKTVIPINQVKTEYRQFEMRRRLLSTYDYFLSEGKVAGHIAHLLGKPFRLKRKLPTSISFQKKNLKAEIDTALKKTIMQMHSNGDSFTVQVGTCSMDKEKVAENILSVIEDLRKQFPGGWENIRCLRLKVPMSMSIPIYMTLKNRNDVKVPIVAPKRPKAYQEVEGELSTFTDNVHVTVAPDGLVKVQKRDDDSDNDNKVKVEDEMQDETEEENE